MRGCHVVAAVAALGAAGCASTDPCAADDVAPAIELGVGENAFVAATEGEDATLVHGPQGGFHLNLSLALDGLGAQERLPVVLTGVVDGVQLAYAAPYVTFLCDRDAGRGVAWGLRLIFDAQPEDLAERDVQVTATLDPGDGTSLADTLALHIVDPLVSTESP
ncbi:MAG: hypothetical protein H6733_07610 [Alphaproteobacteria bacterium]|nr:hypothetical protein [Alphaproteobacteria bacterium]